MTRKKLALKLALAIMFAIVMTVIKRFEPSLQSVKTYNMFYRIPTPIPASGSPPTLWMQSRARWPTWHRTTGRMAIRSLVLPA